MAVDRPRGQFLGVAARVHRLPPWHLVGITSPSGSATTSFCPGAWATRQRAHALVGAHARARRPQQQHQRDNARASGTRAGSVGSGLSYVGQSDVGHSPDHTHTHTHTPTSLYV